VVDVALRDALTTLKNKINSVASAETVTAEDLAMLATAVQRIAGEVSVDEFTVVADEKAAELAQQLVNATATLNAAGASITAALNTLMAQKTVEMNDMTTDAVGAVRDASLADILTPVIPAGSVERDAYGRISRYDQGNGVVLTDIRYERERILGWRETYTKPDSSTVIYDYTVHYHLTTGEIVSLTRSVV
jgi:hypothetical protein